MTWIGNEEVSAAAAIDEWADKYGDLKRGGAGSASAWLGIPLIVASLIGMLWAAPMPARFSDASPAINYATLFIMATFVYYCILSISLGLAALLFLILAALPSLWATRSDLPLGPVAAVVFTGALAWQLNETRRATGRLLVVRNLQYLMLGPIWLLREACRNLGLGY